MNLKGLASLIQSFSQSVSQLLVVVRGARTNHDHREKSQSNVCELVRLSPCTLVNAGRQGVNSMKISPRRLPKRMNFTSDLSPERNEFSENFTPSTSKENEFCVPFISRKEWIQWKFHPVDFQREWILRPIYFPKGMNSVKISPRRLPKRMNFASHLFPESIFIVKRKKNTAIDNARSPKVFFVLSWGLSNNIPLLLCPPSRRRARTRIRWLE